jgi:hypothetical protein
MQWMVSTRVAMLAAMLLGIGGCGGGSHGDTPGPTPGTGEAGGPARGQTPNQISGLVGGTPQGGAMVTVMASSGATLGKLTSNDRAEYELVLRTPDSNYPLVIFAEGGSDMVTGGPPDFRLAGVALGPATHTISNLNPFSTLIHEAAAQGGGISGESVAAAREAVLQFHGFGLDTALIPDPASTRLDDQNVHKYVRAGAALSEMIRRTRDALAASGSSLDGDGVVASLGADLTDGVLDGRGAPGSDERLAAVAAVATAAVMVETMTDRLQVGAVDAARALDLAIRQIRPYASTGATAGMGNIPESAVDQAERALWAAYVLEAHPAIAAAIDAVVASRTAAALTPQLPDGLEEVLASRLLKAAYAGDTEIAAVNAIARGDPVPGSGKAIVRWTPPTERTDGTPLSTVSSFKVYYGRSPSKLNRSFKVGGHQKSRAIENLAPGTWYFAVTAIDEYGVQSARSKVGKKTIS